MSNLSGQTPRGIPYPVAGIDSYDPAGALQDVVHALDAWASQVDTRIATLPRFIQASNVTNAQNLSANDPNNIYWVRL